MYMSYHDLENYCIAKLDINWDDADPSEMLKLQEYNGPVYTSQIISVTCNASYFYLGSGMYFTLFKQDSPSINANDDVNAVREQLKEIHEGVEEERNELEAAKERIIYEDANIGGVSSKLPMIRTLEAFEFSFKIPGSYKLTCHAPVWNTTDWAMESTVVIVKGKVK